VFLREVGQGLVLGLMLAAIGMLRVWMWGDGLGFMLTIGATLIAIPLMGCTVGSMLPLLLRRVGIDPATSSTPFIATLIDVLGIMVYFNVAKILLAEVISAHLR
jgi:magnesium transporter